MCADEIPAQYIGWIADGQLAWVLKQPGMAADTIVEISDRPVPQEPMVHIHDYLVVCAR